MMAERTRRASEIDESDELDEIDELDELDKRAEQPGVSYGSSGGGADAEHERRTIVEEASQSSEHAAQVRVGFQITRVQQDSGSLLFPFRLIENPGNRRTCPRQALLPHR